MRRIYKNGLYYRVFDNLSNQRSIEHLVTERNRNTEKEGNTELNLSFKTGENVKVEKNRKKIIRLFRNPPDKIFIPNQCHTAVVKKVDPFTREQELNSTDAIVTNRKGICIGILTADCVPVLLYDPVKGVIAAIHAGWRGTVAGIVKNAIEVMSQSFGSHPSDLVAAIGPSISGKNYQVGPEVVEQFGKEFDAQLIFSDYTAEGKANLDLWECNRQGLLNCGVRNDRIELAGICTYDQVSHFFSARREGLNTGRFASFIMMI